MCDAAVLFFDENSVDEETECLRRVKKPFDMTMQEFLSSCRALVSARKFLIVILGQGVPELSETEQIRSIHNACPETGVTLCKRVTPRHPT